MKIIRKETNKLGGTDDNSGSFSPCLLHLPPNTHLTILACSFSCTTWCYNEYKHGCGTLCCTETRSPFPLTLTCCKPSTSSETCLCYTLLLQREWGGGTHKACLFFQGDLRMACPYATLNRKHHPFNCIGFLLLSPHQLLSGTLLLFSNNYTCPVRVAC